MTNKQLFSILLLVFSIFAFHWSISTGNTLFIILCAGLLVVDAKILLTEMIKPKE